MATLAAEVATERVQNGAWACIENPARSYLWQLPALRALAALPGMRAWSGFNCLFGGQRRKATTFLSNLDLAAFVRQCPAQGPCARTGRQHASWAPRRDPHSGR